jgi:dUTPase
MKIQVKEIPNLVVPSRAPEHDSSGYDVVAVAEPKIFGNPVYEKILLGEDVLMGWRRIDWIEYHTGLFISPQTDNYGLKYHTLIMPRSSLRKYNLTLANSIGLIDVDYRGELILCFHYLWQPEDLFQYRNALIGTVNMDRIYKKGDAIGQIVAEVKNTIDWVAVANLDETIRGQGGFGSREEKSLVQQTQHTQEKVTDHKTSSSPLLDRYKGSPLEVPSHTVSYETLIKEREKQIS